MALGALQFAAFLSYSRKDERLARWLVRALEDFQPPRPTIDELKAKGAGFTAPRPIFRDVHDMPVGGAIPDRLAEVIDASAAMIVLCTPASVQSGWVDKEIRLFAERHPDRRIIAVVAEGDPDSDECYPRALLSLGKPLAADLRSPSARRQAVVKIAAAMLGLDVDQLVGRVGKRRAERVRWIATGASVVAGLVIGLSAVAVFMTLNANSANDRARANVEKLLTDTRAEMDEIGLLKAKAAVHDAAKTYFDGKAGRRMNSKDLLLKAEWLRQEGEDALKRGDAAEALAARQEAYALSTELLKRDADDPKNLFSYGQSAYWMGEYFYQQGQLHEVRPYWKEYQDTAERLLASAPDYPDAADEVHYARVNMGVLALEEQHDPHAASDLFLAAIKILEANVRDADDMLNLSRGYQFYVDAIAQYAPASEVLEAVHDWEPLLNELQKLPNPGDDLEFHLPNARSKISVIKRRAGGTSPATGSDRGQSPDRDPQNAQATAMTREMRVAAGGAQCASLPAPSQMNVTDRSSLRLIGACLPGLPAAQQRARCSAFVTALGPQPDRPLLELAWALFLTACSRVGAETGDAALSQEIEDSARQRFFRWRYEQLSLPTQFQLAGFRTLKPDAWTTGLKASLGSRGWIIEER